MRRQSPTSMAPLAMAALGLSTSLAAAQAAPAARVTGLSLLARRAGIAAPEEAMTVHSFRIFVACALLAANAPRWLIKRMLRWRGDESLEVYARLNNTEWAGWTAKLVDVAVQFTISSRLNFMDFSGETTAHFNNVAHSMLAMSVGRARGTNEAV